MRQVSKIDLLGLAGVAGMAANERETSNALVRRLHEHIRGMRLRLEALERWMRDEPEQAGAMPTELRVRLGGGDSS